MISNRVKDLKESATLKINAQVNALKAEGKTIYNMTAGEPDFPPPAEAKRAVMDAVEKNLSKYTPTAGIPELRKLIAENANSQHPELAKTNPWKPSEVVVSNGGKQAIFDAILALINPGDEVVFGAPYWLSYPEMVKVADGKSVVIPTLLARDYKFSAQELEHVLTPRSKLLILNSPSNPTGTIYDRTELEAIGAVLARHPQVWILSDEIYDRIDFDGKWCSFLDACPELRDRTVTVNGLSKSGAMTGWRIGWSIAPQTLTSALISLQGHSTSGISSLSQAAAVAALKLPRENFAPFLKEYLHRRSLALEVLGKSAKIKVYEPAGAFYLFLDVREVLREKQNADGFAEKVLQDIQVAVVSGVDFGAPTCIRLSFATDEETIRTACERLADYCR